MFAPRNVGKKKVQMSLKPIKSKSKAAPNVLAPKCSIEEEESSATASTTGTGAVEPAPKKRKSRWGSATATSADSVEGDAGAHLEAVGAGKRALDAGRFSLGGLIEAADRTDAMLCVHLV